MVQICPLAFLKLPTCGSQGNCLLAFCTDIILCFSDYKTHYSWLSGIYKGRFEGVISFSLRPCIETDPSVKPKNSRNRVLPAAAGTPWGDGGSAGVWVGEWGVLCLLLKDREQWTQAAPGDREPDLHCLLLQGHSSSFSLFSQAVTEL